MAKAKKARKKSAKKSTKRARKGARKGARKKARKSTKGGKCKVIRVCGKMRRICWKKKGKRLVIASNRPA